MRRFENWHPIVLLFYFASIFLIIMFSANPFLLLVALVNGIPFVVLLEGSRAVKKSMPFYFMLFGVIVFTNPIFSHRGVTPLLFVNGNPITLEAILYGINIAVMLLAVLFWFQCFNKIMTSDKLLYLFGKCSPKLALVLSSALRFVPLFQAQAKKIRQTQRAMGAFTNDSWLEQLRGTLRIYASLITWALENAIDTGASMKGRGYGLKGRSHFALFRFTSVDALLLASILLFDSVVLFTMAEGYLDFRFYPTVTEFTWDMVSVVAILAFAVLTLLPVVDYGVRLKSFVR